MDRTVSPVGDNEVKMRIAPERMAWALLLLGFAIFCTILVATTLWLHYFLFQSSLQLDTELRVSRGTVGVMSSGGTQEAVTSQRFLDGSSSIRTDRTDLWSQAVINFRDPKQARPLVARVILRSDTEVRLQRGLRPRFDWSNVGYEIQLDDLNGEVYLQVANNLEKDVLVSLKTGQDEEIRITQAGRYAVFSSDTRTRVVADQGELILIASDGMTAASIPAGQQAFVEAGTNIIEKQPAMENLLTNSQLDVPGSDPEVALNAAERERNVGQPPQGWSCTNQPVQNRPLGDYYEDLGPDGTVALHLIRSREADTNGRTLCEQSFGKGLDVTDYEYLTLEAYAYVKYQSLNGCGAEASECPLMVSIQYKINPESDVTYEWIHGVYTRPLAPSQESWKRQCDTCLQPHIQIYDNTWYIYDSGNLFEAIPSERRPAVITNVEFFAEGHSYDVFVDEVALHAQRSVADQQLEPGA